MNVKLDVRDIDRSHRIGPKPADGKPRPIICKFATYNVKATFLSNKKNLSKGVFVNEDLTRARAETHKAIRQLWRDRKIHSFWIRDGVILFKPKLNDKPVRVRYKFEVTDFIDANNTTYF